VKKEITGIQFIFFLRMWMRKTKTFLRHTTRKKQTTYLRFCLNSGFAVIAF